MQHAPAIWITGLPASGKSTLARALGEELSRHGIHATVIESDTARRIITPEPTYDEEERDLFYAAITYAAALLTQQGIPVIVDATANRRRYRDRARELIPAFVEIYVECPRQVCVARDRKGVYEFAINAESNNVPGAGAPYERPILPEFLVHGDREDPHQAARRIVEALFDKRLLDAPCGMLADALGGDQP
jgi:adenylylsulfate kinase